MNTAEILDNIETAIAQESPYQVVPMQGDRWIFSSAMQKAIRRGDEVRAVRAAVALWEQDRQNFWRRLHVIALEDIGVASLDVVVKVLTATASSTWRRRHGDREVGLHLVRVLCRSVKTRVADELLIQVERAGCHTALREQFSKADDTTLTACAVDERRALVERALALWFLFGMKRFPSDLMPGRNGSPEVAVKVLRSLNAPAELTEACIGVMKKSPWPLSVFTPLVWQTLQKQKTSIRHNAIPAVPDVDGIPVYAADLYTRTGQACFRQLRHAVLEFKRFSVRQIGVGVFHECGGRLDREITSPLPDALRQHGEAAEAESVGLIPAEHQRLRESIVQHMELLNSIRQDELRRYVNAIQGKPTITLSGDNGGIA